MSCSVGDMRNRLGQAFYVFYRSARDWFGSTLPLWNVTSTDQWKCEIFIFFKWLLRLRRSLLKALSEAQMWAQYNEVWQSHHLSLTCFMNMPIMRLSQSVSDRVEKKRKLVHLSNHPPFSRIFLTLSSVSSVSSVSYHLVTVIYLYIHHLWASNLLKHLLHRLCSVYGL